CLDHVTYSLSQSKSAVSAATPKPKKDDMYSKLKADRSIVLLSCLGKLCEKALAVRLH
ncbi:uncharacterized protein BXZ73DRAFT_44253, partial [Epithele typhae]|uniref:uncharacterized protein n=1 Tax=Epithele typhae TaxID=378194 RepID=UPI00200891AA